MGGRAKDRWPELCKLVERDDGLRVRASGQWAEQKLYVWNRYIEITTRAMIGKPAWKAGLVYVDLFAGPGVCEIKGTGRRFPGSPLLAAHAPKEFGKILLCEKDAQIADACRIRMQASPASGRFTMFTGDCNELVDDIAHAIPKGALTLAFVDPTGLHAKIDTIVRLSASGPVDVLVLFPDRYDAERNIENLYLPQLRMNLDHVLGADSDWRAGYGQLPSAGGPQFRRWLSDLYRQQLERKAGYTHFRDEVISGPQGPLYRLIYATKNPRGLNFWDKIITKESSGQKRFF